VASENNSRVIVIGLDGATIDLIGPLLKKGKMPNLSKMWTNGSYTKLYSTIPPLSPPAWTTFSTGKAPEKHGVFDFSKRKKGTYDFIPTSSVDCKEETLWDIIGARGGKSIAVNVPLTYPPTKIKGVMISGFPTPPRRKDYTYPRELLPELERKFGEVNIHKPQVMYRKGREEELTEEMIRITKQQTEITKFLMNEIPWQLTVSVYDATDVLGHYFWAYLDPNHPKFDSKFSKRVKELVTDIHVSLDDAIGELAKAAGMDSLKFVISDHGFGPVYYGVYVNNWLLDQDYMHFKTDPKVRIKYYAYRHGLHLYNLLQLAKKLHLVKSIESAYSTNLFS
jgi:predicted AlkP superfamily phosphohydrolase/phosphomutase